MRSRVSDYFISIASQFHIINTMSTSQTHFSNLAGRIKETRLSSLVKLNDYVDVFDNFNSWRVAYILDIRGEELKVRFDGWSPKYDETHRVNSSKVALFRVHTEPYTGGKQVASRDFHIESDIDRMRQIVQRLQVMVIQNFQGEDPYELQQFLRGEVYFLVDSILQENKNLIDDELAAVCEFLETFMKFIISWMSYVSEQEGALAQYIEGRCHDARVIAFDLNCSLVSCFPELFDSLNKIFYGGSSRTKRFYQTNEFQLVRLVKERSSSYACNAKERYSSMNSQVIAFINFFGENDGFSKLMSLMKWRSEEATFRTPLSLVQWMLQIIESISGSITKEFREEYCKELKECIFERVVNITASDESSTLFSILKHIPKSFFWVENINQEAECQEIKLSVAFMKSNVLEKKIRGVKQLRDIVEVVSKANFYGSKSETLYFNEVTLSQYFQQESIFETLMSSCFHPETLKRSSAIFKFFALKVGFKEEELQTLWHLSQNRHESEQREIYNVIAEMAKVMPKKNLEYILAQISGTPLKEYDIGLLNFMRDFTVNCYANKESKGEVQGITLLWKLIQDDSELGDDLVSGAMMSFISCIKEMKSLREAYFHACLENVRKGVSQPQSLLVAQHILDSFGSSAGSWQKDTSEELLGKAVKDTNLVDLIVRDLEGYRRSQKPVEDANAILVGKVSHQNHVQYRLEFIQYIHYIIPKKVDIGIDNFQRLFHILVTDPVHETDRKIFLEMLIKSANSSNKYTLIKDSNAEELFRTVFTDRRLFERQVMTYSLYKSVEKYFLCYNQRNQYIALHKGIYKVSRYDRIVGLDFFWTALQFGQEDVANAAGNMLVLIHLRTEKLSQVDQKVAIWNSFLKTCKALLKQSQDARCHSQVIRIMKQLIKQIEGKKFVNATQENNVLVKFTVQIQKDEKTLRHLELPSNLTFIEMRRRINKEYNLKDSDYDFYFANYDIKLSQDQEEDYSVQSIEDARDRDKVDVQLLNLSSSPYPLFHAIHKFKTTLANNAEISEILFELLQSVQENQSDDIWEILTLLPKNKGIKHQIDKIGNDKSEENWNRVLHMSNPRKLLYCLEIVSCLMEEKKEKEVWMFEFLKMRGVYWLLKYYYNIPESHFKLTFNLKLVAALALTVNAFYKAFAGQYLELFDFMQVEAQFSISLGLKSVGYLQTFLQVSPLSTGNDCTIGSFVEAIFRFLLTIIKPTQVQCILGAIEKLLESVYTSALSAQLRQAFQAQVLKLAAHFDLYAQLIQFVVKDILYLPLLTSLLLDCPHHLNDIDLQPITAQVLQKNGHFDFLYGASLHNKQAFHFIAQSNELRIVHRLFAFSNDASQQPVFDASAYHLLIKLVSISTPIKKEMIHILNQYIEGAYWRTPTYQNWNISQMQMHKSRTGYVGLKNLGCTCYMNSLMQQLFTLPHFRDPILQIPIKDPGSVLHQFQFLLSALKSSQKQYFDPRPLCNVLGPNGSAINFAEQMDVDEFWSGFMDKLETELKPLKKDLLIGRNFGGLVSNELICKDCPHESSREELFLSLSLQVKGKKDIYESLRTVTEGEMLEGDNAYFCEKCEKKVSTLMRVCVKKLPNVLLVVLKRFEFNLETLTKQKLNDYCEFPMELNMQEYTHEFLKAQEWTKRKEEDDTFEAPFDLPQYPPEYYHYHLRGVIIHIGTADSGHYYSLIKDHNSHWFEFNDTLVKPFDIADLPAEAFGNNDAKAGHGGGISKDRHRNAYIVFYERSVYFDDDGKPLKNENELKWYFNKENDEKQNEEILQDNIKFQINKIMFDPHFFDFQLNLLKSNPSSVSIVQVVFQYFMVVVIRSQDRSKLPELYKLLKQSIRSNLQVASNIVQAFSHHDILHEFLINNHIPDMNSIVIGLLSLAVNTVAQKLDKVVPFPKFKESPNVALIESFLALFWECRQKKSDFFLKVSTVLVLSSANAKLYMLQHKSIGRILLYLLDQPPHGAGYQDMDTFRGDVPLLKLNKTFIQQEAESAQFQTSNRWDTNLHNYTYLIVTLSELLYGLQHFKDHELDDDEIALFEDQALISRLLSLSFTRKARNALGLMFSHLITIKLTDDGYDPWAVSMRLVTQIYNHLKDCSEQDVKACLVGLRYIANSKDGFEEQRSKLVMEAMVLSLKDGLDYWVYTQIVLDFILKLCSGSKKFVLALSEILNKNRNVQKLIEKWISESANPLNNFGLQRWKIFRKRNSQYNSHELTQNTKYFEAKAGQRREKLKKVSQNQMVEGYGYDSDDEMQQLEVGAEIDCIFPARAVFNECYDFQNYQTWQIVESVDEMIEIKQNQNKKWTFADDDSIAPAHKAVARFKDFFLFFK